MHRWLLLRWLLNDFKQLKNKTKKKSSNFANFKQLKKISSHFANFKTLNNSKKLVVILLTLDNSEKVGCNFAYFKQLKNSNNFAHFGQLKKKKEEKASVITDKSKLGSVYTKNALKSIVLKEDPCIFFIRQKLLFGETLCYLWEAIPCQWSLYFLVLSML